MTSEPKFTDPKTLAWAVKSRRQVQELLCETYTIALRHKELVREQEVRTSLLQCLTGIGFSLWRAAFLAMPSRDPAHVVTESLRFLEIIVRDNAIGYPQERPNAAWTAGYYVNNAYFRLQFAQTKLLKCKKGEPFSDALATLTCNCEDENSYPDMQLRWDLCFEAAAEALKLFRHSYEPETANIPAPPLR